MKTILTVLACAACSGALAACSSADREPSEDDGAVVLENALGGTDPLNPESCPGAGIRDAWQAASLLPPGSERRDLGAVTFALRARRCSTVTGCGDWSVATEAAFFNGLDRSAGGIPGFPVSGRAVMRIERGLRQAWIVVDLFGPQWPRPTSGPPPSDDYVYGIRQGASLSSPDPRRRAFSPAGFTELAAPARAWALPEGPSSNVVQLVYLGEPLTVSAASHEEFKLTSHCVQAIVRSPELGHVGSYVQYELGALGHF